MEKQKEKTFSGQETLSNEELPPPAERKGDIYQLPAAPTPPEQTKDLDVGNALLNLRSESAGKRIGTARLIGDMAFMKRIKIPEAVETLANMLINDKDPTARAEAAWALWKLGDHKADKALIHALSNDKSIEVREKSARALGLLGVLDAIPLMIALISMGRQLHPRLRAGLISSLGLMPDNRSSKFIFKATKDTEPSVRFEAVKSLGRYLSDINGKISKDAFSNIKKAANPKKERIPAIRQAAIKALRIHGRDNSKEIIICAALKDPDPDTRRLAVESLLCFDGPEIESALLDAFDDSNWDVKKLAALTLMRYLKGSKIFDKPRIFESISRMERIFPSGSREWRLAAAIFPSI